MSFIPTHRPGPARAALFLLAASLLASCATSPRIKSDETVLLLPTVGHYDAGTDAWRIPIHSWVYEDEEDSVWRSALAKRLYSRRFPRQDAEAEARYRGRAWMFTVDNERGKQPAVSVEPRPNVFHPVGTTGANGHAHGWIDLAANAVPKARERPRWLATRALLPNDDERQFKGRVQLVPPRGISVISDIDDTIKVSRILLREEIFNNTFIEPYSAVPGMAEAYRRWADQGVAFHYVSGSPWQLYPALHGFMADGGFPEGSFHLRLVRFKDETLFNLFKESTVYKRPAIDDLLGRFPQRQFVLIGDLGEHDAEVYAETARRHPGQIISVWLRRPEEVEDDRAALDQKVSVAFSAAPNVRWQVFETGADLPAALGAPGQPNPLRTPPRQR